MQDFQNLLDLKTTNIWRYHSFYPSIDTKNWLSLGEGGTPFEDKEGTIFKREDQNPTGSIKDRGMAYQISHAYYSHDQHLVLSSSGNAAISAAAYCRQANIKLSVFVSPRIEEGKLKKLQSLDLDLHVSETPIKDASIFRKKYKLRNLRQSVDENAASGGMSLGFELYEDLLIKQPGERISIFLPVSSATNLVGIGRAFQILKKLSFIEGLPEIHAVQSTYINPIAREFDKKEPQSPIHEGLGLTKALCAINTRRKDEAVNIIKQSKGFGWIVDDKQIKAASTWLANQNIETSFEGAAALAAIFKAKKTRDLGKVICVLTGKKYYADYHRIT